jgi:sulfur-oxidizing protein SoxY
MTSQAFMAGTTRRHAIALGAGALSLALVRPARATPAAMAAAVKAFVGTAKVVKGRVALEIPALVENGNSVPLKISVASLMSPLSYVRSIAVFAEKNPLPNVATFRLQPRKAPAVVQTRIRLGDSQNLLVIAELSDGTFWSDSAELIVTLPACVET